MPKGHIPSEQLCVKIKALAEAGTTYIYSDLTAGQVHEFQELGYKIEFNQYDRRYKIEWK